MGSREKNNKDGSLVKRKNKKDYRWKKGRK